MPAPTTQATRGVLLSSSCATPPAATHGSARPTRHTMRCSNAAKSRVSRRRSKATRRRTSPRLWPQRPVRLAAMQALVARLLRVPRRTTLCLASLQSVPTSCRTTCSVTVSQERCVCRLLARVAEPSPQPLVLVPARSQLYTVPRPWRFTSSWREPLPLQAIRHQHAWWWTPTREMLPLWPALVPSTSCSHCSKVSSAATGLAQQPHGRRTAAWAWRPSRRPSSRHNRTIRTATTTACRQYAARLQRYCTRAHMHSGRRWPACAS